MDKREASWNASLAHVRRWQGGGQTRVAYCADHGLNVHTFDNWRRKANAPLTVVPVVVREEVAATIASAIRSTTIVVSCRNGVRLELEPAVDVPWLIDLLRGLGAC